MIDLPAFQKRVYANKVNKGFNVTDVNYEFCRTYGELAEAFDSYNKNDGGVGGELADVVIYLCGIAEILGVDLEDEIKKKMEINEKRRYINVNGVNIKVDCD